MSYLEEMLAMAKEKGVDPEKVKDDLLTVASIFPGLSVEDIAYSFVMATKWEPEMFADFDREKQ